MWGSMKTNAEATLYNKTINPSTRAEEFQRTVLTAVYWENRRAVNKIASGGDIKADKAMVMIPQSEGANYLDPVAWQKLADKTGKWTLQAGDVIVRGAVTDEITDEVIDELTEEVTPAFTVSDLKRKYDDVLSITTVDWMDAGSEKVNHWEIGAV